MILRRPGSVGSGPLGSDVDGIPTYYDKYVLQLPNPATTRRPVCALARG